MMAHSTSPGTLVIVAPDGISTELCLGGHEVLLTRALSVARSPSYLSELTYNDTHPLRLLRWTLQKSYTTQPYDGWRYRIGPGWYSARSEESSKHQSVYFHIDDVGNARFIGVGRSAYEEALAEVTRLHTPQTTLEHVEDVLSRLDASEWAKVVADAGVCSKRLGELEERVQKLFGIKLPRLNGKLLAYARIRRLLTFAHHRPGDSDESLCVYKSKEVKTWLGPQRGLVCRGPDVLWKARRWGS